MQAMVYNRYGPPDVLELQEVAQPTPADNEVLIKVHAAAVNAGDWHLLRGTPYMMRLMFGLRAPRYPVLGSDVAGEVAAVGSGVSQFQPGDAVFGDLSGSGFGAFAEYATAPEAAIVRKPASISFEQAAAVPGSAITALQGLRDHGQLQAGQQVVVNGAAGGVGSFAVQIAKALGAHVTGVCSTGKVELVRSLGADQVIDYTQEDFTRRGPQYDLILDTAAYRSLLDYQRALRPGGRYVLVGGAMANMMQAMLFGPLISTTGGKTATGMLAKPNQKDLLFLQELLEAGSVVPAIDRSYPLSEVAEALRYLEAGSSRGKVVITVRSVA